MNKYSQSIDAFLTFLRECEQEYHMAQADEQEQGDISQDILHSLELEEHTYNEYAKLGKKLKEVRQKRRIAKDTIMASEPVMDWIDKNKGTIKDLEQLLGKVRKAERSTENRIYTPRKGGASTK